MFVCCINELYSQDKRRLLVVIFTKNCLRINLWRFSEKLCIFLLIDSKVEKPLNCFD